MPNFIPIFAKSFFAFILLIFLSVEANAAARRPFIIDTDVGVDDVIAIFYLLQRPDIDVKAITIASTGNAHCLPALRNVLGLLKLMKRNDIPVECGPLNPLNGQHHFPDSVLEEADTLSGTAKLLPQVTATSQQKGVELLIETIQKSKQPITILAIGPLTNIAEALQRAPKIKNNIQAIYILGGAINVPGNLSSVGVPKSNKTAEWNIYIDPIAAAIVLNHSIPIVLVPLDATNTVPMDMDFYKALKKNHRSPAANFIFTLLNKNLQMLTAQQWYFWDPLSAVIASDESIASFTIQPLRVVLAPEVQSGRIIIDTVNGQNIRIATQVNQKKFKEMLLNGLNKTFTEPKKGIS